MKSLSEAFPLVQSTAKEGRELRERELPDDYPIRQGYLYVIDGVVGRAMLTTTVKRLRQVGVASVKNCDINGRSLWHLAL